MLRSFGCYLSGPRFRASQIVPGQVRNVSWKSEELPNEDIVAARKWASTLNERTVPRSIARVRFDRASGKGGQHVNTTSSKATCTWDMRLLSSHVPKLLHQELRKSPYFAPNSDTLVIQSQSSRSQHDNENECHQKFHQLLRDLSKRLIPGETSPEQKRKVEHIPHKPREGWATWSRKNKVFGKQLLAVMKEADHAKAQEKKRKKGFFTASPNIKQKKIGHTNKDRLFFTSNDHDGWTPP